VRASPICIKIEAALGAERDRKDDLVLLGPAPH